MENNNRNSVAQIINYYIDEHNGLRQYIYKVLYHSGEPDMYSNSLLRRAPIVILVLKKKVPHSIYERCDDLYRFNLSAKWGSIGWFLVTDAADLARKLLREPINGTINGADLLEIRF